MASAPGGEPGGGGGGGSGGPDPPPAPVPLPAPTAQPAARTTRRARRCSIAHQLTAAVAAVQVASADDGHSKRGSKRLSSSAKAVEAAEAAHASQETTHGGSRRAECAETLSAGQRLWLMQQQRRKMAEVCQKGPLRWNFLRDPNGRCARDSSSTSSSSTSTTEGSGEHQVELAIAVRGLRAIAPSLVRRQSRSQASGLSKLLRSVTGGVVGKGKSSSTSTSSGSSGVDFASTVTRGMAAVNSTWRVSVAVSDPCDRPVPPWQLNYRAATATEWIAIAPALVSAVSSAYSHELRQSREGSPRAVFAAADRSSLPAVRCSLDVESGCLPLSQVIQGKRSSSDDTSTAAAAAGGDGDDGEGEDDPGAESADAAAGDEEGTEFASEEASVSYALSRAAATPTADALLLDAPPPPAQQQQPQQQLPPSGWAPANEEDSVALCFARTLLLTLPRARGQRALLRFDLEFRSALLDSPFLFARTYAASTDVWRVARGDGAVGATAAVDGVAAAASSIGSSIGSSSSSSGGGGGTANASSSIVTTRNTASNGSGSGSGSSCAGVGGDTSEGRVDSLGLIHSLHAMDVREACLAVPASSPFTRHATFAASARRPAFYALLACPLRRPMGQSYALRGRAGQLLRAREEVSEVAFCYHVPYLYLHFRRTELARELRLLASAPPSCTVGDGLIESLRSMIGRYDAWIKHCKGRARMAQGEGDSGKPLCGGLPAAPGPSFKPSKAKSDSVEAPVPTNLHVQLLVAADAEGKESVFDFVTVGAPAAHALGFKEGGAVSLRTQLQQLRDGTALEAYSETMSAIGMGPDPTSLLDSIGRKADRTALQLQERVDLVVSQTLTAVITAFAVRVELALSRGHTALMRQYRRLGFLFSLESLLSTHGKERGMLEDAAVGMEAMESVRFALKPLKAGRPYGITIARWRDTEWWRRQQQRRKRRRKASRGTRERDADDTGAESPCEDEAEGGSSTSSKDDGEEEKKEEDKSRAAEEEEEEGICVTLFIPRELHVQLPRSLQHGRHAVRARPLLFSQGINERQTVANAMGDSTQQQDINRTALSSLEEYFSEYRACASELGVSRLGMSVAERLLARLQGEVRAGGSGSKNVEILRVSSDLVRWIGGARLTCCKSSKDRTSMSVTLEQARLLCRHLDVVEGGPVCANDLIAANATVPPFAVPTRPPRWAQCPVGGAGASGEGGWVIDAATDEASGEGGGAIDAATDEASGESGWVIDAATDEASGERGGVIDAATDEASGEGGGATDAATDEASGEGGGAIDAATDEASGEGGGATDAARGGASGERGGVIGVDMAPPPPPLRRRSALLLPPPAPASHALLLVEALQRTPGTKAGATAVGTEARMAALRRMGQLRRTHSAVERRSALPAASMGRTASARAPRASGALTRSPNPLMRLRAATGSEEGASSESPLARVEAAAVELEEEDRENRAAVKWVADLMREHGVRLANAHKNTGKRVFAFNAFQRKMLPAMYRPPTSVIGSNQS